MIPQLFWEAKDTPPPPPDTWGKVGLPGQCCRQCLLSGWPCQGNLTDLHQGCLRWEVEALKGFKYETNLLPLLLSPSLRWNVTFFTRIERGAGAGETLFFKNYISHGGRRPARQCVVLHSACKGRTQGRKSLKTHLHIKMKEKQVSEDNPDYREVPG